ncbi:cytochrome P450 ClCP1 [Pseudomassariella vexata]|uniref:Cytochrome P450 ClCP1 n=1 Tax=Pseudomassariella vexata TaxID=1141098 RepID=A0A1Y2DSV6_9PEZI|nr:cytochrome P450 ClCP1 [Pseudomassariella vexata]ORY62226.1 cytochrome P450 ClCP1 [Pseudomassariella vexata]
MALLSLSMGNVVALILGSVICYTLGTCIYNVWLHPLRNFPGPLMMRATRWPYHYKLIKGTLPLEVLDLHNRYGEVVRIAPNELAFANASAWNDIQGHRTKGGQAEMEKDMKFYRAVDDMESDIVNADRAEHSLLRRSLAHGFSDKSLRDQEPLITSYIDLLLQRLRENCDAGKKALNMAAWYNFATFDIIGDLAFGESFGCLENSAYHPWVGIIFKMARAGTILQVLNHFPRTKRYLLKLVPKSMAEQQEKHDALTRAKLERRMASGERPDFVETMLKKKETLGLTIAKLQANSSILIIGGSETTATLLSGVTYFLAMNQDALKKVTEEVRAAFKSEDEINFTTVNDLNYMLGCLNEALRMYPPVPSGLPRVVPQGGAHICGYYVPQGVTVGIYQWALYHNSKFFKDPFEFHPERFLGDAKYDSDEKNAFQPFHVGPRNCIGRNLAYVEMRTIMARILFNFDLEIAEDSKGWIDQKIFNLWAKGALNVYLKPVVRD